MMKFLDVKTIKKRNIIRQSNHLADKTPLYRSHSQRRSQASLSWWDKYDTLFVARKILGYSRTRNGKT